MKGGSIGKYFIYLLYKFEMARIIPSEVDPKEFHTSYGEKKIYEALKSLPDEYIVFYSLHWNKRNKKNLICVSFSQGKETGRLMN